MLKRTLIAATLSLGLSAGVAAQAAEPPRRVASEAPSLQDRVDALAQQIYRRYQHYPPALASQRAAAEQVLAAWNDIAPHGEEQTSAENVARMADWLDAALRAVMPGASGELPAAPEFEESPTAIVDSALPGVDSVLVEPTEAVASPAAAESRAAVVPQAVEPQAVEPQANVEQRQQRSRIKVSDPVTTIDNPYVDDTDLATDRPRASGNPLRQSPPRQEAQVRSKPSESQFVGPRATAKPVVPEPAAGQADPAAPQRSKWSQHPSAAPLEWRDPFADDPTASPNPLRSGSRHETRRPEYRLTRASTVNLRQLGAEIRGYNAALRSLQSAVMKLKESDVAALTAADEELDRLDERRQFLDLYRAGLSPDEQRLLPESPSAEVVRELVRRKTEALSGRAPSSQREERHAQQTDWFESF